jgi:ABC-2 type transport system ATP-binding protein
VKREGSGPKTAAAAAASGRGISVERATRWYGATLAVDAASFRVQPGEVVGFLGPNGAGKSTILKMISTWLPPSDGHVRVEGHDVVLEPLAVRRALGYLPEHNSLYEGMRVDRLLDFAARIRGLTKPLVQERFDWVVEHCALSSVLEKRVHECSKGYRQRIGLAIALIHNPPVIALDEPTHGLDPLQVVEFRRFIGALRKDRAILFSSHIVSEVVAVSDRLIVINSGKLLADMPIKDLAQRARDRGTDVEALVLEAVTAGGIPCVTPTV